MNLWREVLRPRIVSRVRKPGKLQRMRLLFEFIDVTWRWPCTHKLNMASSDRWRCDVCWISPLLWSTQLQNTAGHFTSSKAREREMSKLKNTCKSCKTIVFLIVKYANLWQSHLLACIVREYIPLKWNIFSVSDCDNYPMNSATIANKKETCKLFSNLVLTIPKSNSSWFLNSKVSVKILEHEKLVSKA